MAVDVTGRQWLINAADVPTLMLPTPVVADKIELSGVNEGAKNAGGTNVKVDQFEFFGYAAVGDKVVIKDVSGRIVWQSTGEDDLSTKRSGCIGWVRGGLQVTVLDSGSLLVYMASK